MENWEHEGDTSLSFKSLTDASTVKLPTITESMVSRQMRTTMHLFNAKTQQTNQQTT